MGLMPGISITIKFDNPTTINPSAPTPKAKSKPALKSTLANKRAKPDSDMKQADSLDVELLTKNRMKDEELMELTTRIVGFIANMLKKKREDVVRYFMDKAKHHLTDDMLGLIKDEIQTHKQKKKSE